MIPRNRLIAVLVLLAAGTAALWLFSTFGVQETTARTFKSLSEMQKFETEDHWGIPEWLPQSSHAIKAKFNFDYGTLLISLRFHPKESEILLKRFGEVTPEAWSSIAPFWGNLTGGDFPKNLVRGEFDDFLKQGFRVGTVTNGNGTASNRTWYALVNLTNGALYTWSRAKMTAETGDGNGGK